MGFENSESEEKSKEPLIVLDIPNSHEPANSSIQENHSSINSSLCNESHQKRRNQWNLPTISQTNAQSLVNKVADIEQHLRNNEIDLCCITESWCSDAIPNNAIKIDNYNISRKNRIGKRGGGILVYIHNSLPFTRISELEDDNHETLWLKLSAKCLPRQFNPLVIGCAYHPPGADHQSMITHIIMSFDQVKVKYPGAGIMLLGDFNKLPDGTIKKNYDMKQIVKKLTHGESFLDLTYTNMYKLYNEPEHMSPIGLSKHQTIMCKPFPSYIHPPARKSKVTTKVFSTHNKAMFARSLQQVHWEPVYLMKSCEEQYQFLECTLVSLLDFHFPSRTVTRTDSEKPWVTDGFRNLVKRRNMAWNAGNTPLYRLLRNRVNRACRNLKSKFYRGKIQQMKTANPKQWWKGVRSLLGKDQGNPLTCMANDLYNGDMEALTDDINTFFKNITAHLNPIDSPNYATDNEAIPDKYQLSVEEVEKALLNVNPNKSGGPDKIPTWLLHDFAGILGKPVCSIFNNSIRSGYIPYIWKCANIAPIPKASPPRHIETDLRPISLTAVLIKTLEGFIYKWLWKILKDHIKDNQFGTIKGSSTTFALIELLDTWGNATDTTDQSVRILLLDYSKAFDLIDHNILLHKLCSYGVPDVLLRWVHTFLWERKQRVKVGSSYSQWSQINGGVPQGTKLGPLLFITMINDLELSLPIVKYVDDTTIFEIKTSSSNSVLPEAAKEVSVWSKENNMKLNPTKTKEMHISFSKQSDILPPVVIDDINIETVSSAKLLGVTVSSDLKWNLHIHNVYSKAAQRLYYIIMLRRSGVKKEDLVELYCYLVRPVVEYACQVWHAGITQELSNILESVQKRALRIIYPDLQYREALQESNLPTLIERRQGLCIALFKSIQQPSHKLHHLLPAPRDIFYNTRNQLKYPLPLYRTNRSKNTFIPWCLFNAQ